MAENKDGTEKSEEATPAQREEKRKEGSVAKSADLTSGIILLTIVIVLYYYAPFFLDNFTEFFKETLRLGNYHLNSDSTYALFLFSLKFMAKLMLPLFVVLFIVAIGINVYQVGFYIAGKAIEPKFDKLNFFTNFMKTFFNKRKLVDLIKSLMKIFVISAVAWYIVVEDIDIIIRMTDADLMDQMDYLTELLFEILLKISFLVLAIGVADFAFQKWQHNQDIRMTKQEVKEEMKRSEGDPLIRQRIRQAQHDAARKRMMDDVPKADVVITNPTHYSVAIRYTVNEDTAPVVIAKGKGLMALRIREIAKENNIPVVEDPPLARLLYEQLSIGDSIPENLFAALAIILQKLDKYKKYLQS